MIFESVPLGSADTIRLAQPLKRRRKGRYEDAKSIEVAKQAAWRSAETDMSLQEGAADTAEFLPLCIPQLLLAIV